MFPSKLKRLVIFQGCVDFRKQWNGLMAEARKLGFDPYDGDLVVFVKRDKRQLRAICGDDKGLYLFSRRFEGGCFSFSFATGTRSINKDELEQWFLGSQVIRKEVTPWR